MKSLPLVAAVHLKNHLVVVVVCGKESVLEDLLQVKTM